MSKWPRQVTLLVENLFIWVIDCVICVDTFVPSKKMVPFTKRHTNWFSCLVYTWFHLIVYFCSLKHIDIIILCGKFKRKKVESRSKKKVKEKHHCYHNKQLIDASMGLWIFIWRENCRPLAQRDIHIIEEVYIPTSWDNLLNASITLNSIFMSHIKRYQTVHVKIHLMATL